MCRILQVAVSGFYAWIHKPLSDRTIEDERLLGADPKLVRSERRGSTEALVIFLDLREAGEQLGRKASRAES